MSAPNILVVVVDGLRASALGAYGNTTYSTQSLDQFAAESLLFDECFAPTTELPALYRAMWQSVHPARLPDASSLHGTRSLQGILAEAGFHTTLISDEPQLLEFQSARDFHECTLIELREDVEALTKADDASDTSVARLFASVAQSIVRTVDGGEPRADSPRLIWVHSRGMYGPWDAPLEFQKSLLDEESSAITSAAVPHIKIGVDDDPDIAFRYTSAYAAEVMALDFAWQILIDAIATASEAGQPWQVVFIGSRGFGLGEDGIIGGTDSRLTAAQLHVPWLIRFPDGRGKLMRSDALVSHVDLAPTLLETEGRDGTPMQMDGLSRFHFSADTPLMDRDLHLSANGTAATVRTPRWCFRTRRGNGTNVNDSASAREADDVESELFVRPDDRWETNDVSKLCPEVLEDLESLMASTLLQFSESRSDRGRG